MDYGTSDDQYRYGVGAVAGYRGAASAAVLWWIEFAGHPDSRGSALELRQDRTRRGSCAGGKEAPEPAGPASGTQKLGWGGPLVVRGPLAGGGTAGHTSPLLAPGGALRDSAPDGESRWLG